jgi:hypothetical protein
MVGFFVGCVMVLVLKAVPNASDGFTAGVLIIGIVTSLVLGQWVKFY